VPKSRLLKFAINAVAAVLCTVGAIEGKNVALRVLFAVAACGSAFFAAIQIPAVRRFGDRIQ
jgi:hypothetical protein